MRPLKPRLFVAKGLRASCLFLCFLSACCLPDTPQLSLSVSRPTADAGELLFFLAALERTALSPTREARLLLANPSEVLSSASAEGGAPSADGNSRQEHKLRCDERETQQAVEESRRLLEAQLAEAPSLNLRWVAREDCLSPSEKGEESRPLPAEGLNGTQPQDEAQETRARTPTEGASSRRPLRALKAAVSRLFIQRKKKTRPSSSAGVEEEFEQQGPSADGGAASTALAEPSDSGAPFPSNFDFQTADEEAPSSTSVCDAGEAREGLSLLSRDLIGEGLLRRRSSFFQESQMTPPKFGLTVRSVCLCLFAAEDQK